MLDQSGMSIFFVISFICFHFKAITSTDLDGVIGIWLIAFFQLWKVFANKLLLYTYVQQPTYVSTTYILQ